MKILQTSDWHLGTFRSPVKDGVNLRTEDTKKCLDELIKVAEEECPDYSLISGDIFHVGRLWSDRCCEEIVMAIHYIKKLAAVSGNVVVMRGTPNHDGIGQFNVLSEMFAGCRNVYIVVTPQILRFDDADIAVLPGFDKGVFRAKFPGISSEKENEVFTQELSNIIMGLKTQCRTDKKSILMAHYTVPGCNMESGQTMMLTQFEPIIPQETLLAADYDLVALGHIHRPQQILSHNWFYSGAINQLNFNDEGQERGFWIHKLVGAAWEHDFHKTPIREHITFDFTDTDITAINLGDMDEVAYNYWRYNGAVKDKIVRVHYSCSAENSKALNRALIDKALLEDGAFMVWEVLPDKIDEFANRTELTGTTDPEANLIKYLEEKQVEPEKVQELVLKARPIIAEAEANMPTASNTGTFEPVEISVKNYRNYEDETFNFEEITFCTINGQNGAGKSSLFMDAIIDCLYEQPREGFCKDDTGRAPWLRNDGSVRSGSIMFTFRIGEKKYRVTRTRARSGKGTLNLSYFVDGEWENCSKERYNDTQQEIINIIGMDSFTFKSCALIMQDQYGLFLQAKPEERVEVLGTLLGLGVYPIMERIAQYEAKAYGTKNNDLKQEIEIHQNTISGFGDPDMELERCRKELAEYENDLQIKTLERDRSRLLLTNQQEAAQRYIKLQTALTMLKAKKDATGQNRATQQAIIERCMVILDRRQEIEEKIAEYDALVERERELAGESALYVSKKQEAESFSRQAVSEQESIDAFKTRVRQKENELSWVQPTDQDAAIKKNAAEYERQKKLLDEAYEQERAYQAVEKKNTEARYALQQINAQYASDMKNLQREEDGLKKKAELLSNVRCVDISQAKCGFLADAISAKQALKDYPKRYAELNKAYEERVIPIRQQMVDSGNQMAEMPFDAGKVAAVSKRIAELKPYVVKLEAINQREGKIALLKADLEHLQSNILEAEKRLAEAKLKAVEAEQERDRYAKVSEEHGQVLGAITELRPWLEKEKQLPVAEERKTTAMGRVLELAAELAEIDAEIIEKQAEADKEAVAMSGVEELAGTVARMNADVDAINTLVKEKQMKIGALQQQADQIFRLKREIVALQEKQVEYAKETADYDMLKAAFSQSGVPHQIIRSIIPQLTATSNTILEQMTGGKVGVEFRLERMLKNGKEKASLDIFIEEYGKSVLPYLSKSGGEKVKSSLSVILALAEIKSSSVGIQLGMLFIDEPPFLDGEGIQAYCDALEIIQSRYRDIKIMAITHDPTMKARFPQNLDVIKTDKGSKVIY
ncbi:MAG: AAA family ATPase [Hungatella sp.]|nr:AAA family ATPase [Hungatella sp.]